MTKLKFRIEQIAISPGETKAKLEAALMLFAALGGGVWIQDRVRAKGTVSGNPTENVAALHFNYELLEKAREFEVLQYVRGDNWLSRARDRDSDDDPAVVSHFGMHVTPDELDLWRRFFAMREISVAQDVWTVAHDNEAIAGKRWYNYVIFDTRSIIGVDLKFIVRKDSAPE